MQILLPLDRQLSIDSEALKQSHSEREFVIFDEALRILFEAENETIVELSIHINEAKVFYSDDPYKFLEQQSEHLWELKRSAIIGQVFNSSIVMNNGHKNFLKILVHYEQESISERNSEEKSSDEDVLPSFLPLSFPGINHTTQDPVETQIDSTEVTFPIHALLNVRLRNVALSSLHFIYSSLDFQASKACETLMNKYNISNLTLHLDKIDYELVRKSTSAKINPVCPLTLPLTLESWNSCSISYKLPQTKSLEPHRVRVTLNYNVVATPHNFVVNTSWEADIALKKQNVPTLPVSQPTSLLATPMFSPSVKFASSVNSLVANRLNNVRFRFLTSKVMCKKGRKLTLFLQIMNSSQSQLDMVVYHTSSVPQNLGQYPIDREYQLRKRWQKTTEGIILLSNDYKLPLILPGETYCAELHFVAIREGYYHGLPGLKILDLNTQEIMNIGSTVSILVE